jgi:hypothetical protein
MKAYAAKTMTRADFQKTQASAHGTAADVIRKHRMMIGLWTAMDRRWPKLVPKKKAKRV